MNGSPCTFQKREELSISDMMGKKKKEEFHVYVIGLKQTALKSKRIQKQNPDFLPIPRSASGPGDDNLCILRETQ